MKYIITKTLIVLSFDFLVVLASQDRQFFLTNDTKDICYNELTFHDRTECISRLLEYWTYGNSPARQTIRTEHEIKDLNI